MVTAKKPPTAIPAVTPKVKSTAKKTAAAPVAAVAPAPVAKKAAVKKAVAAKVPTKATRPSVSVEQRHNYIEVAAFYVAQRRGFAPGNPVDDWAMAEQEVDSLITSGHFSS